MTTKLGNWLSNVTEWFYSLKDKNLDWRTQNQDQQLKLKQARILAEAELTAELKKRSTLLEQHLALLKVSHDNELAMLKIKCKQDIKDYKHYLQSLDQLKRSIQASYTHLPEAVVFTIHHHAKQLLNEMWETQDLSQKMHHEMQLITFMTTVHEEAQLYLQGDIKQNLPEKTLALIHTAEVSATADQP